MFTLEVSNRIPSPLSASTIMKIKFNHLIFTLEVFNKIPPHGQLIYNRSEQVRTETTSVLGHIYYQFMKICVLINIRI